MADFRRRDTVQGNVFDHHVRRHGDDASDVTRRGARVDERNRRFQAEPISMQLTFVPRVN